MSGIGPTEILIVLGIVVLLFGGKKLPELARGSGRALRIFKTEVKDLGDDDKTRREEIEPADPTVARPVDHPIDTTADRKPEQG